MVDIVLILLRRICFAKRSPNGSCCQNPKHRKASPLLPKAIFTLEREREKRARRCGRCSCREEKVLRLRGELRRCGLLLHLHLLLLLLLFLFLKKSRGEERFRLLSSVVGVAALLPDAIFPREEEKNNKEEEEEEEEAGFQRRRRRRQLPLLLLSRSLLCSRSREEEV
jgi:hypothetical protein